MKYFSQKGVSLYLALMIMSVILAVAFGISSIFLGQAGVFKEMGYSVMAFYAADTGIEEILLNRSNPVSFCTKDDPCQLENEATYYLDIRASGDNCSALYFCIKSIGEYKEVKRAIEISY
jgi:hypothetical protein